jgi:hypothetical protein
MFTLHLGRISFRGDSDAGWKVWTRSGVNAARLREAAPSTWERWRPAGEFRASSLEHSLEQKLAGEDASAPRMEDHAVYK